MKCPFCNSEELIVIDSRPVTEENGKLVLQINKPQCKAQNIEISFVDNNWSKLK